MYEVFPKTCQVSFKDLAEVPADFGVFQPGYLDDANALGGIRP